MAELSIEALRPLLLLGTAEKGPNIIVNIPPQEREIFGSKFVLDLDFGDSALSAREVLALSREMELPPPHVLLQLDAIIVAQRESDGAAARSQSR